MKPLLRKLTGEFGRRWCLAWHSPFALQMLEHRKLGFIAMCCTCRRLHLP